MCAMFFSKQPTQHWLVGSEQGKVTHLDTIERCHTHVEEHTIEHWHGNELKNTEHSKKDINVTRVTVTLKKRGNRNTHIKATLSEET